MPRPLAIAFAVCLGLCAGCGNSRTPVPSLTAPTSGGPSRSFSYPAAGVSFSAPRGWTQVAARAPLVALLASGGAVVAVWRYPRRGRVPATAGRLRAAARALVAAARRRDPSLQVIGTHALAVDHAPAVELEAFERVAGQPRRSRALHVFVPGGEIVVDEYAPPNTFATADREVFAPLDRSLVISAAA